MPPPQQHFQNQHALKKSTPKPEVCRVAIVILNYLRDHPQAKDSLQGIAKWWVGEETEVVEKALAFLIHEGAMEKQRHIYRAAPDKCAQSDITIIEKTLRQLQGTK